MIVITLCCCLLFIAELFCSNGLGKYVDSVDSRIPDSSLRLTVPSLQLICRFAVTICGFNCSAGDRPANAQVTGTVPVNRMSV